MDDLRIQIIARDLNRMLEDMAAIDTGVEFSAPVDTVATRVSQGALGRTRAAREENIRRNHERATYVTLDGKLYKLSNFFHNDAIWGRIQNFRAARLQQKLGARGLAKQSWLHAGNKVRASSRHGFIPPMRAPGFVQSANYLGRQYPDDVDTYSAGDGSAYSRTLVNNSPLIGGAGMESALYLSMQGETRYFERLMAHQFYRTYESRAAKYPGVFTRPTAFAAALPAGIN